MIRLLLLLAAITASPAFAEEPLRMLEIQAHPRAESIVEGEMVPVTVRGVYDGRITLEDLKILPGESFDWVQLDRDDWHEERIDGRTRIVVERHLAIYPKQSGFSRFGPAEHRLTFVGSDGKAETVVSHPLDLSVAPMPQGPPFHSPHGWRFAAAELRVTDELSTDPARLKDGETVTRSVTVTAVGALPAMLPPRPVISENWLIAFAAPVERRLELTPDGPVASVVWTWQFRPETGEPGVLPAVPIPFFNTVTRKVEAVEIPALPIGYASFAASQSAGMQLDAASTRGVILALVTGLGVGLAVLVSGHRPTAYALHRLWRHYSPLPGWRLRRAARAGDLLALRRAAEERSAECVGRPDVLSDLDRAIYGPPPQTFDARAFLRILRSQIRRGAAGK
ncbi:hypothetical protein [Rhodobacter sp. NSM]|uniref:hypothetical protein n=1 Tax=Rhodobacter sp. NSM TaxID=3457501 RepID=UPI003FD4FFDD